MFVSGVRMLKMPKKIFVCSKLKGNQEENIKKAKQYCKYVIRQGHIPFAPHIYFTLFLDDSIESEREIGINSGLEWLKLCEELWAFDSEPSEGMLKEIEFARKNNIPVVRMENFKKK